MLDLPSSRFRQYVQRARTGPGRGGLRFRRAAAVTQRANSSVVGPIRTRRPHLRGRDLSRGRVIPGGLAHWTGTRRGDPGILERIRDVRSSLLDAVIGHDAGSFGSTKPSVFSTIVHISSVVAPLRVLASMSTRPEPTATAAMHEIPDPLFVSSTTWRPAFDVVFVVCPPLGLTSSSPCAGRTVMLNATPPAPFVTDLFH